MRQFNSKTFVCFLDISGFKIELKRNLQDAAEMLDTFYSAGYQTLKKYPTLNGIFVSDSGIIYPDKGTLTERLAAVLLAVRDINDLMLNKNFLMMASIAFGYLEYRKKISFDRIKKNAILGNGYLNAFLDSIDDHNKILPGQVRIIKLEEISIQRDIIREIDLNNPTLTYLQDKGSHFYYHWYLSNEEDKALADDVFAKFLINQDPDKFDTLKIDLMNLRKNRMR